MRIIAAAFIACIISPCMAQVKSKHAEYVESLAASANIPKGATVDIYCHSDPVDSGYYNVHFKKGPYRTAKCDHKIKGRIFWTGTQWRWKGNELKEKGYSVACVDYIGHRVKETIIDGPTGKVSGTIIDYLDPKAKVWFRYSERDEVRMSSSKVKSRAYHNLGTPGSDSLLWRAVSPKLCRHCGGPMFMQNHGTWVHDTFNGEGGYISCADHKRGKAIPNHPGGPPYAEPIEKP